MTMTHEMASESEFSSITHLLTTNSTPAPHAKNTIHRIISSIDKDICQAELDIAELQKALEQRTADRDGLIQRRASLRGVVSSLRQFPVEILEQIFLLKSNQRDKIKDKISGCPHRTNG